MSYLRAAIAIALVVFGIRCANAPVDDAYTEIERKGGEEQVFAFDLVGDTFSKYRWTLDAPQGSVATLSSLEGSSTSFVPDSSGLYVVELIFSDDDVEGTKRHAFELLDDSFSVTLMGPEQVVQGALVVATATAHDAEGGLDYRWEPVYQTGETVPFTSLGANSIQFVAAEVGYYRIVASIEDAVGNRRTERITVRSIEGS